MKKLNESRNTARLPMPAKVKKGFRVYSSLMLAMALVTGMSIHAFAAGDPITVINNLSDFIFGLIRAVGLILLGWGIVQVGLSFSSHDPSQRSNGFLTLAGGVVITFAKEILTLITGRSHLQRGRAASAALPHSAKRRTHECQITGSYRTWKTR